MPATRTVHDPFLDKKVEISNDLIDRLRGRYAVGPTMENGEPEFGWRTFDVPPIQHQAATEIERLRAAMHTARKLIGAINDTATPAVKASNINQAWHVLNDNLRSHEQGTKE